MTYLNVNSSRGQVKIQQMAFVLVAIVIFFSMVLLFYLSIRTNSLEGDVESLREQEAKDMVRKLSGSPEFSWEIESCASCLDLDKVFMIKGNEAYGGFWDAPFLQIEKVYPKSEDECTISNYPDCGKITLIEKGDFVAHSAFVALCFYDEQIGNKCELGKVHLGFESIK